MLFYYRLYKLSALKTLTLSYNTDLKRIEEDILNLTNLCHLNCTECSSLEYPPYAVCQEGISAIRKYFTDLKEATGSSVVQIPISVLGATLAG